MTFSRRAGPGHLRHGGRHVVVSAAPPSPVAACAPSSTVARFNRYEDACRRSRNGAYRAVRRSISGTRSRRSRSASRNVFDAASRRFAPHDSISRGSSHFQRNQLSRGRCRIASCESCVSTIRVPVVSKAIRAPGKRCAISTMARRGTALSPGPGRGRLRVGSRPGPTKGTPLTGGDLPRQSETVSELPFGSIGCAASPRRSTPLVLACPTPPLRRPLVRCV